MRVTQPSSWSSRPRDKHPSTNMTDARGISAYPGRADLIGSMQPILKAARRPLTSEWERNGLDLNGLRLLERLVSKLVRDAHFEHLGRDEIREAIRQAVLRYRASNPKERKAGREVAAEVLDAVAREPLRGTLYLGVEHLKLPHGTVVGDVRFVDPSVDRELVDALARFGAAPQLLCEIEVTAGTSELLRERARDKAETALGLLRQQNLFGFNAKIYLDQVVYGLDGTWALRDGSTITQAGWWREKLRPSPMGLDHANGSDWRARLAELSDLYLAVAPDLRQRVDTCIGWLDVAARSDRWRIIIPAIFSGMEALLGDWCLSRP